MIQPVSVLVASRNRPEMLLEAVTSVLKGEDVPAEMVVIDQSDAPNPGLLALANRDQARVRYVPCRTVGLSKANNTAIALANQDILVFTHDDVLVAPDWLTNLVQSLIRAGPRAVVTGRVLAAEAERPDGFVPTLNLRDTPTTYRGRIWADVLYPLNMAMYRSALDEVGPFDERLGPGTPFPGAEDNDMGYRLLEAGYTIHYQPQATVYHRAWRGEHERDALRLAYSTAQGGFYAKHMGHGDAYVWARALREVAIRSYVFLQQFRKNRPVARNQVLSVRGLRAGAWLWWRTYGSRKGRSPSDYVSA